MNPKRRLTDLSERPSLATHLLGTTEGRMVWRTESQVEMRHGAGGHSVKFYFQARLAAKKFWLEV